MDQEKLLKTKKLLIKDLHIIDYWIAQMPKNWDKNLEMGNHSYLRLRKNLRKKQLEIVTNLLKGKVVTERLPRW